MSEFKSNVPTLEGYTRRQRKSIELLPDSGLIDTTLKPNTGSGQTQGQTNPMASMMNPAKDSVENEYDFGANLGDM